MRLSGGLPYYNASLHSSDNPCCGARHLRRLLKAVLSCRPRPLAENRFIRHYNALPSLPCCFHIFFSFSAGALSLPCVKGGGCPYGQTEGLSFSTHYNPPVSSADSSLRRARSRLCLSTGQAFTTATALRLPFTQGGLFPCLQSFYKLRCKSVKGRRLYRIKEKRLCSKTKAFKISN